jgi:hypothetical protein
MCVLSWVGAIAVLYGRYGVAGLNINSDVTAFLGVPTSVLGTIVVVHILRLGHHERCRDDIRCLLEEAPTTYYIILMIDDWLLASLSQSRRWQLDCLPNSGNLQYYILHF